MARRRTREPPSLALLLAQVASDDPETRWLAAKDLGTHGDRSAILLLEGVALDAAACFQREGAYVDTTEYPFEAALDALRSIYGRHPPSDEDMARMRARIADPRVPADDAERLAAVAGKATRELVAPLLAHAVPAIRLRAINANARAEGEQANRALWADDEQVRLAATEQDAYRSGLVRAALERFSDEPSVSVRRGISDLWLRYRARMGGPLRSFELAHQLVDDDIEIHTRVARHVLDVARGKGASWIDDPGGLRPVRARLVTMLEPGRDPGPADVLRDVQALVERTLAPFDR